MVDRIDSRSVVNGIIAMRNITETLLHELGYTECQTRYQSRNKIEFQFGLMHD
jgi:hypothetical protein